MKSWTFYVVRCADGSLYAGITTDVDRRLKQHNGQLRGGAKYTRTRRSVSVVFTLPCASHSDALRQEHAFKKLTKKKKLQFIGQE